VRTVAVLLVSLLPIAALIISACATGQSLNDWLDKADAVCRAVQDNADRNPAPQSPLPGDEIRLSATRSRAALEELRELTPPDDRGSAVQDYLITLGRRVDALEHYAEALDKAPAQGPAPPRASLEDVTNQAFTQAVALGLEDCAGGVDFAVETTSTTTTMLEGGPTTTPGPTGVAGQPEDEEVTQDQPG
jgi:hypothetical protein